MDNHTSNSTLKYPQSQTRPTVRPIFSTSKSLWILLFYKRSKNRFCLILKMNVYLKSYQGFSNVRLFTVDAQLSDGLKINQILAGVMRRGFTWSVSFALIYKIFYIGLQSGQRLRLPESYIVSNVNGVEGITNL